MHKGSRGLGVQVWFLIAVMLTLLSCGSSVDQAVEPIARHQSAVLVPAYNKESFFKASNTEQGDQFRLLAISADGNTAVAGAPFESRGASGIGGDQNNNNLGLSGAIYVFVRSGGSWVQQAYIKASLAKSLAGFGNKAALSADGNTLAVAAANENSNATGVNGNESNTSANLAGAVYVFTRTAGVWTQRAYVKATNTEAGDLFGSSVALSGDGSTLAVGARSEDSNAVGMNGAQGNNSAAQSGAVYVLTRSGNSWSHQAYIKASNTGADDNFGTSVALSNDGNTLAVGASGEDSDAIGLNGSQTSNNFGNSGAAYAFTRSGAVWSQQAYVKATNTGSLDEFGTSVSLSADGNKLVVGAPKEDSISTGVNGLQSDNSAAESGAAYVYVRAGSIWLTQAYFKASNTESGDAFGSSVALSGDGSTLAAGAPAEDALNILGNPDNSGAAYVFAYSAGTWSHQAYIKVSKIGGDIDDAVGTTVTLTTDGSQLATGAPGEDSNATGVNGNELDFSATSSGAGYVFTRSFVPTHEQQAYIKSSNSQAGDQLAAVAGGIATPLAVSSDGNTIAVGAIGEDSSATGINGNSGDNNASNSGAVYVLVRSGSLWTQQAYIKASNTQTEDFFGGSVALSADGNTLAVGAYQEDSGIPGNQSDNSMSGAGAVYVFTRSGTNWSQQAYIKASNVGAGDYFGLPVALPGTAIRSPRGQDSRTAPLPA